MSLLKTETAGPEHKSAMREPSTQTAEVESAGDATRLMSACRKPRTDLKSMTVRQYLDQTVAPVLLHALQAVARERPTDPITYVATYLLKNRNRCDEIDTEAA